MTAPFRNPLTEGPEVRLIVHHWLVHKDGQAGLHERLTAGYVLMALVGCHNHRIDLSDHVFRAPDHIRNVGSFRHMPGIGWVVGPDVRYLSVGDAQRILGFFVQVNGDAGEGNSPASPGYVNHWEASQL